MIQPRLQWSCGPPFQQHCFCQRSAAEGCSVKQHRWKGSAMTTGLPQPLSSNSLTSLGLPLSLQCSLPRVPSIPSPRDSTKVVLLKSYTGKVQSLCDKAYWKAICDPWAYTPDLGNVAYREGVHVFWDSTSLSCSTCILSLSVLQNFWLWERHARAIAADQGADSKHLKHSPFTCTWNCKEAPSTKLFYHRNLGPERDSGWAFPHEVKNGAQCWIKGHFNPM